MDDWRERVINERAELQAKFVRLLGFMSSEQFVALDSVAREQLETQAMAMLGYLNALEARIDTAIIGLTRAIKTSANDKTTD